jgi:pimeloyl-ACP methyl ester carboxylesterase
MCKLLFTLCVTMPLAIAQEPAPPGKLVDVGGHRVHIYCTGQGSPTVIAIGAFSVDWALVQRQVSAFTRMCTYDVAGTAWSEPGPANTCRDRTSELHTLLQNAGVSGPFVLAGLSIGGLVSRYYASQYQGEVAGMVLVDHAFTPQQEPHEQRPTPANSGDSPPVLIEAEPIVLSTEDTSDFNKLPAGIRDLHRWAASRSPAVDHGAAADDCLARLKSARPYPLGAIPLSVISSGNQAPGYSELQTQLLKLSRNSKQLMANRSFHSVEIDQPEVVVDAIRQAVESVRREQR